VAGKVRLDNFKRRVIDLVVKPANWRLTETG